MSAQIIFTLWTLGAQNIAKKRYMKCTFSLGLVGARYPLDLELPVISVGPGESDFLCFFCKLSGTFMSVYIHIM